MSHTIKIVKEFHEKFGHPVAPRVTTPDAKTRLLRFRLLVEEVLEFGRAIGVAGLCEQSQEDFERMAKSVLDTYSINPAHETNLADAADALGDVDYVTQGANLVFGFPAEAVTAEIHRANMSKLGADGKPVYDEHGKIQKGPNYIKPDVAAVLHLIEETRNVWLEDAPTADSAAND